jgi:hypothetical protein
MPPPPTLDPALPALPLAFDMEALSRRFQEQWERAGGRRAAVGGCRRIDTTYVPGERCVATYEIIGEGPGGTKSRTFGVLNVDSSGATPRLFPDDPELPALSSAANADVMHERIAALPADVTGIKVIDSCEITPVRYKPGERCVLRYDLRSRREHASLFGKLVAAGGDVLFATLTALHDAGETTPATPGVPRPLFFWRDLDLVLQSEVTATPLGARALDASSPQRVRTRWMRSAGGGLAAMHRMSLAGGPRRTLLDDARDLETYGTLFTQLAPRLGRLFRDAIVATSRYALANREPAPVASHGALRADQLLVDRDDNLVLMDLDGFCRATPARDIGNLFAYLEWRAIRRPEDAVLIDDARRAFLEGYEEASPRPDSSWLAVFTAGSMLKIAGRRFRSLNFEEWGLVPKLLDAASEALPI